MRWLGARPGGALRASGRETRLRVAPGGDQGQQEGNRPKNAERTEKTLQNLGLGAAGVFLVVPWFFMDIKGKEAVETEALERRNAALRRIAFEKGCNAPLHLGAHERKAGAGERGN